MVTMTMMNSYDDAEFDEADFDEADEFDDAELDTAKPVKPVPAGTTWWWQLSSLPTSTHGKQLVDLDLEAVTADKIKTFHQSNAQVICYFSGGSYESWRSDAKLISAKARGKKMDGWNELWIDVREASVRTVMKNRITLAASKGCDGVEVDNVDGYDNATGFPLTKQNAIDFLKYLAGVAHDLGLSMALKNAPAIVPSVVSFLDFAITEECSTYNECSSYSPFIKANKAVLQAEYKAFNTGVCNTSKKNKFSCLFFTKGKELNGLNVVTC